MTKSWTANVIFKVLYILHFVREALNYTTVSHQLTAECGYIWMNGKIDIYLGDIKDHMLFLIMGNLEAGQNVTHPHFNSYFKKEVDCNFCKLPIGSQ